MRRIAYLLVLVLCLAGAYVYLEKKRDKIPGQQVNQSEPAVVSVVHEQTTAPLNYGQVADFTLTDQLGREFQLANMKDKVLIVNFFFTSCHGPCPVMTKKMEALQGKLANHSNVNLVSISIDPNTDTVPALKAYAEKNNVNSEKWALLTGSKDKIVEIMEKSMKLGGGQDIQTHATKFVLLDQKSNIVGYYDSMSEEDLSKLEQDAVALAKLVGTDTKEG